MDFIWVYYWLNNGKLNTKLRDFLNEFYDLYLFKWMCRKLWIFLFFLLINELVFEVVSYHVIIKVLKYEMSVGELFELHT